MILAARLALNFAIWHDLTLKFLSPRLAADRVTLHYILAPHTETSTQRGYGEIQELTLGTRQSSTVPSPPLLSFPALHPPLTMTIRPQT